VFNAIYGPDGRDDTVVDAPFTWNPDIPLSKLRIGYVKAEFEARPDTGRGAGEGGRGEATGRGGGRGGISPEEREAQRKLLNDALDVYRSLGATLQPIELTATRIAAPISFVLSTEAAAAFDDLTRSPEINDPSLGNWPNAFRAHRFVPAVEYIRAQRARTLLIREMDKLMSEFDVFLSPTGSSSLGLTNLTGHPAVALRAGFHNNFPVELMITGRLYEEGAVLRAGLAYERATKWHLQTPTL
jgi:Asp-tRNA(Asn)/Glu-tRNA(Gln) amidotransferase A subunit family amidase